MYALLGGGPPRKNFRELLDFLRGGVVPDQVFKNGEHVAAIFDDAFEHRAEVRLALTFTVPLGEDGGGNGDVAPQFLGGVPAQEQTVKKCGFALRKLEILRGLVQRIGLSCHVEKGSLQISASPSRVLAAQNETVIAS